MNKKPFALLLLYGLDEKTLPVDAEVTLGMLKRANEVLLSRGWQVAVTEAKSDLVSTLAPFPPDKWIVFNLCEGSPSQHFYYARVAAELTRLGYAFTGSEAESLHDTQFKPVMKRMLEAGQVPTPAWTSAECVEDLQFDTFPAIVKPAAEHCSFGITRDSVVFNLVEVRLQASKLIKQYEGGVLVEEFLDSEEYGVSLCGPSDALEIIGISVIRYNKLKDIHDRLCTFDAKWLPDCEAYKNTMPECPAVVSDTLRSQLETIARRAHVVCDVRDYSRIDIRLSGGRPMVLDVNGNCALSENSGFPDTARIAGVDYGCLLDRLATMALERALVDTRHFRSSQSQTVTRG